MLIWMKKLGHYKSKKIFKSIYKNGKKCKIWWYWNQKTKMSPTWNTYFSKNIDINKIVVSNKVSFGKKGFKYFIGYKDAKIRPLCIFLPKMSAYRRDFDETK